MCVNESASGGVFISLMMCRGARTCVMAPSWCVPAIFSPSFTRMMVGSPYTCDTRAALFAQCIHNVSCCRDVLARVDLASHTSRFAK